VTARRGALLLIPTPLGEPPAPLALPADALFACGRLRRWIAENAKTCRAFLKRVQAGQPLAVPLQQMAIDELPKHRPLSEEEARALLAPALAGEDIGLVSDAGAPGVADPGAVVVAQAHALGLAVAPCVGPSSIVLALMAGGLNGQRFAFHGYLPKHQAECGREIARLEQHSLQYQQTQLFIETPYRNLALLAALLATLRPTTRLCVAAGLTTPQQFIRMRAVAQWRRDAAAPIDGIPAVFALQA
jgi:16S rRNA (cytidine1402-2'-O)-methyltransferase